MKRRNFFKGLLGGIGLIGLGRWPVTPEDSGSNPEYPAIGKMSKGYYGFKWNHNVPYNIIPIEESDKKIADNLNKLLEHSLINWKKELEKDLFKNL